MLNKNIILEYKSISDDVADFAEYVGNAIINDAKNQQKTASDQTYQFFKENIFQIRVRNFRELPPPKRGFFLIQRHGLH